MTVIHKPNLVEVLEKENIELKQRGRYLWALCPLHQERTSSFMVDVEKQKFHCFGCHAHGDIIDFIMQSRKISFKDALHYLEITNNSVYIKPNPQVTRRRELIKRFNIWCSDYAKYCCEMIRLCNQIDALVLSPENLDVKGLNAAYLLGDIYNYHLTILNGFDDQSRLELYKEVVRAEAI